MILWAHPSAQPKGHLDRFSRFCTDDRRVSLYFIMGHPFPPKNCPFPLLWLLAFTTACTVNSLHYRASRDVLLITGSAVALHCCKAHSKINRKMEISTSCKIVTPENFTLKLGTRDYVEEVTQSNFAQ